MPQINSAVRKMDSPHSVARQRKGKVSEIAAGQEGGRCGWTRCGPATTLPIWLVEGAIVKEI